MGFECIIILVPGGANNILLRLCTPLIHAHADNLGLIWEVRNKLIIISLYLNNLFHSGMGNLDHMLLIQPADDLLMSELPFLLNFFNVDEEELTQM